MRCVKLTLAYDGAGFAGWQRQAAQRTVQGELERALTRIDGRAVTVSGAGRTDAGAHAAGQVASARLAGALEPDAVLRALNATLPADVRVRAVEDMPGEFHARVHARGKTYHYWIWSGRVVPPLMRGIVWHVPHALDVAAMSRAARLFEGTHDFASFQASGSHVLTTTRTITASRLAVVPASDWATAIPDDGATLLRYTVSGTGFLRHMVRILAGTLVEVGRARRAASDVPSLLAARRRPAAGRTAPAHGLCLWSVDYGKAR